MIRALLVSMYGFQNIGVRLLAATLREAGFDATTLFFKHWANNDVHEPTEADYAALQKHIRQLSPDIVGIGFGTPYLKIAGKTVGKIREVSSAHIILGGVHPTISPEDCIDFADSVCIGEGEGPIVDLARAINEGRKVSGIANLWINNDGDVEKNNLRPLIENLDDLPFHKMHEVDAWAIESGHLRNFEPQQGNAVYRVFASRGCPFNCSYCYNSQYRQIYEGLGRYNRRRSVKNVLAELQAALRQFPGIKRIRFDDDTFVFPKAWLDEFIATYPKEIGLHFDLLMNPQVFDNELFARLKKAGLVHVQLGVQSASKKELENDYARQGSDEQVLSVCTSLSKLGIDMTLDVILDNPLAEESDKRAMLDLLLKIPRPFSVFMYSLTVFPKSQIAQKLLDEGYITEDDIEGRATKSFRQFRLTLTYPRPPIDTFYASLISLASKSFVPRSLIVWLSDNEYLKAHPLSLRLFAQATNTIKVGQLAFKMLLNGELSFFKLKEYGSPKRWLIQ